MKLFSLENVFIIKTQITKYESSIPIYLYDTICKYYRYFIINV